MCVRLSVCIRPAPIGRIFVKFGIEDFTKKFRGTTDLIKADNNIWNFAWRPKQVYTVDSSTKYFVTRQRCKGNTLLRSMAQLSGFILLTVTCRSPTMHTERIVAFLLQQWFRDLAGIAQSVYRFTTGWTVRESNSGRSEIFRTRPDRPCGPPSLLYNDTGSLSRR